MSEARWQFRLLTLFKVVTACACVLGICCALGPDGLRRVGITLTLLAIVPLISYVCIVCYTRVLGAIIDAVLRPFFLR